MNFSARIGLENSGLLLEPADVCNNVANVVGRHLFDLWHIAELPMMRLNTVGGRPLECGIAVMMRLIDLVNKRRPLCGPPPPPRHDTQSNWP